MLTYTSSNGPIYMIKKIGNVPDIEHALQLDLEMFTRKVYEVKGNAIRVIHQEGWIPSENVSQDERQVVEFIWYWVPVLAYAWVLAFLSSLSSPEQHFHTILHTVSTYSPVESLFFPRLNIFSSVFSNFSHFNDKFYHVAAYTLLGLLAYRAIRFTWGHKLGPMATLVTVFAVTLFGCSDEFHQWFTPLREVDGWDVMADTIGGLIGVSLWEWAMTIPLVSFLEEQIPNKLHFMRNLTESKA